LRRFLIAHTVAGVRLRIAVLAVCAAGLVAAPPAAATSVSEAVQFLNQQRAANGMSANVTVDDYRTTGCRNHNHYMAVNGIGHGEDPNKEGYTPEGADYSNSGEVIAQGGIGWSAAENPWDQAPLHQAILFDPRVGKTGYDESEGFACMRLEIVFSNPPTPTFFAYTGDLGRTEVPPREVVCCEHPYAPQEAVGISQGVPTGPNILFSSQGFGFNNHAVSYSLTGPSGPVDVRFVDSTTTPPPAGQGYKAFYTGGDMIPVQPLAAFTNYTATVTWHNDDDNSAPEMPQTVSFKTGGFERGLALKLSKKLARGRKATLTAPAEAGGQSATVKIGLLKRGKTKARTVSTKQITLKGSQKIKVPAAPKGGKTVVTVKVASFIQGDTRFTVTPATRSYR
jgi:hypothetical protein